MKRLAAAAAALIMSSGTGQTAVGQTPPTDPRVITAPTVAQIAAAQVKAFPNAWRTGVIDMSCLITVTGAAKDCLLPAMPKDRADLGPVALSLVGFFLLEPATVDGKPAETRKDLTIRFGCPGQACTTPDWVKKPTSQQLYLAWPSQGAKQSGRGVIQCVVTREGLLRDCVAASETPAQSGFASAALSLAPQFIFKPATIDGRPVEFRIGIPVVFDCSQNNCPSATAYSNKVATGINFARAPSLQEVAAAYPEKARAKRLAGSASLQCTLRKDALTDCDVMSELPKGEGFARAAQNLSVKFQAPTNIPPGTKTDGLHVRMAFAFTARMLDGDAPAIGSPILMVAPTGAEMMSAYPKAALAANVAKGTVTTACTVAAGGVLDGCRTVGETPPGYGFGDAVLSLMPQFKVATWTEEGLPIIGGLIKIPITMQIEDRRGAPAP